MNEKILAQRIVVVGTTGSGKSTLARQLADLNDGKCVEMDNLNWGPNWTEATDEQIIKRVQIALDCERWVLDGNYSRVRHIVWPRAELIVWLDYPLPLILWRLFRRTFRRTLTQEPLWDSQNRERFWPQFFSKESLFLWAVQTHKRRQRTYPVALQQPQHQHLALLRFHHPKETQAWLNSLASG
jgi:adenylate kinase family enzyme